MSSQPGSRPETGKGVSESHRWGNLPQEKPENTRRIFKNLSQKLHEGLVVGCKARSMPRWGSRTLLSFLPMDRPTVTRWIDQLADGDQQAAEQLWQHISLRLEDFARQKLDDRIRRRYDEHDAANSAFHSLCRGLADGRLEADNRDAFWGMLAVITSRKIIAQRRQLNAQKRGGKALRGESGFGEFGSAGINEVDGQQARPDVLAEVSESCSELLNAIEDESLKKIVLLKFEGWKNGEVATELDCSRRTIERKLEKIRRIWVDAGLHETGE